MAGAGADPGGFLQSSGNPVKELTKVNDCA